MTNILLFIHLFLLTQLAPLISSIGYGFSVSQSPWGGLEGREGAVCNYVSKYGIQMNLSHELIAELEWKPNKNKRSTPPTTMLEWDERVQLNYKDLEKPQKNCSDEHWILEHLLKDYDKFRIPGEGNVRVEVEIWVQEVSKIIEITSEFELDIYVTEWWLDSRLAFSHLNPCKKNMSVDGARVLPEIWNPLGCFVNSKDATVHKSPFSNIFLQLIKLTGPCSNTFNRFPIDQQRCMLFYESFNHNYEQVQMEWTMSPIILLKPNITLPDYVLVDFKASSVKRLYPPGIWNELVATFTFKRLYGFYILQVYIPTYISVCMSWISFYLGKDNIPSRTMIGVNSLLSLTYQFGSVVANLPKTSDIKAIDVMILIAMGFIFSSLIELAVVGYLVSAQTEKNEKLHNCWWGCLCCPELTASKIDQVSFILFPTCFVIFNIWYWFIFMG
uniref:Uncharacterized protein n=1 Tax=Meloidogyne incognita TaxID=6306 RepID=A0A914KLE8_MELIC